MSEHGPFYGTVIARDQQQEYIQKILSKYRGEPATEQLRAKVYDELMWEKHLGNITIPFKVIMVKDESHHGMDYIDVLLDSKV